MKRKELLIAYKKILIEIKLNLIISEAIESKIPTLGGARVKVLTLNRRCLPQFRGKFSN